MMYAMRTTPLARALLLALTLARGARATEIGIDGGRFTINGEPTFLLGCSYYGGLGASEETVRADLDELKRHGFNWVRVWATWAAFDHDVSAVAGDTGGERRPYRDRLKHLVEECDDRGMIVDVTLSRGDGATGPALLQGLDAHRKAVEVLLTTMPDRKNWYIDLANERNIRDARFVSPEELADLRALVKREDPTRLVTASHAGGDLSKQDVEAYLTKVPVDFISCHRPRDRQSPKQTAEKTKQVRQWIGEVLGAGKAVPLHYDEPFRRGYTDWEPTADDFWTDLQGARSAGAAGWCFHNGAQKNGPDGRPRRSFDLTDRTLFVQLDAEEKKFLARLLGGENGSR
jgi:hypothetical protein